jgi:hypothetical protein
MYTLCEPSSPVCTWETGGAEGRVLGRYNAFVSDDIVSYPPSFTSGAAPAAAEASHAKEPVPTVYRQPANEPAPPAKVGIAAARTTIIASPRPLQSPARRLHQSNFGGQRQMGGVKQTNRFSTRRQFS